MARARLHIICGNCGCNDELTSEIVKDGCDVGDGSFRDSVYIYCRNCGTLHNLEDTMKEYKE